MVSSRMNQSLSKFLKLLPIVSDHLVLRVPILSDASLLLKMDQDEEVQRFLGGIKETTKEQREQFLLREIEKYKSSKCGQLTLVLKKTDTPIGFIKFAINDLEKSAELSFILDFDHWKKGYCTEICTRLIEIGFKELGLGQIRADTKEDNHSSLNVLKRLGFEIEGREKGFLHFRVASTFV